LLLPRADGEPRVAIVCPLCAKIYLDGSGPWRLLPRVSGREHRASPRPESLILAEREQDALPAVGRATLAREAPTVLSAMRRVEGLG
jgi:hypothetical protein